MAQINVHEAKTHLSKILDRVSAGEEIIIAKAGKPVARIVPLFPAGNPRVPGTYRGRLEISEDFDGPLPDDVLDSFEDPSA